MTLHPTRAPRFNPHGRRPETWVQLVHGAASYGALFTQSPVTLSQTGVTQIEADLTFVATSGDVLLQAAGGNYTFLGLFNSNGNVSASPSVVPYTGLGNTGLSSTTTDAPMVCRAGLDITPKSPPPVPMRRHFAGLNRDDRTVSIRIRSPAASIAATPSNLAWYNGRDLRRSNRGHVHSRPDD